MTDPKKVKYDNYARALRLMRRQFEHFDRMALRDMLSRFIDNGDGTISIPKPRILIRKSKS